MNTWIRTSRLLNRVMTLGLGLGLGVGAVLTGCSTTSGPRTGAVSKFKTFLSVGDKPMPVVSGEPGSTVAADTESDPASERRRVRADGRISGRVYDAENRPVPDARVRLAVSGAAGGKVVSATTDRSGAFTLHGLRPGSYYTVIAEWEGDDGVVTGRADARTSDTDVRISLGPQDDPPARASAPVRVDRVSDREPADEAEPGAVAPAPGAGPGDEPRPATPVNEEDLPPAREAEAMAPDSASSPRSRASVSTRPDAWKRGGQSRAGNPNPPDSILPAGATDGPEDAPVDAEARGTAAPAPEAAPSLDDGENPLPPALEPIPEKSAAVDPEPAPAGPAPEALPLEPDPFVGEPPIVAADTPGPTLESLIEGSTSTRRPAASSPFECPTSPTETTSSTPPDDSAPGALVVVPETFGPVVVHDPDPFAGSHPTAAAPAPAPAVAPRPVRTKPGAGPAPIASTRPRPSSATATASRPAARPARAIGGEPRRPTWGEVVAAISASSPTPEGLAVTGAAAAPPAGGARQVAHAVRSHEPARVDRATRTVKTSFDKPECQYDDRLRRVIDFRLPDLDGKPVRFQDLDADLVLIDFWGTWCQPCLRSMPHLVELQERMGKRLKVVGIACEADAPEASAPKVAETARRLNINYPVLLSRNDGSCPLQEALHIQAFPTMILVDRQGRVLWRDQGATPATLARLDRIIDSSPRGGEVRRY